MDGRADDEAVSPFGSYHAREQGLLPKIERERIALAYDFQSTTRTEPAVKLGEGATRGAKQAASGHPAWHEWQKAWVGELPLEAALTDLENRFSQVGAPKRCSSFGDGTGVVCFQTYYEAKRSAWVYDGSTVGTQAIKCRIWAWWTKELREPSEEERD